MAKPLKKEKNNGFISCLLLLMTLFATHAMMMGMEMEMEMEMDSETSRRVLWAATEKRYISYEALKGDVVPCSRPGAPYYNCRGLPTANPYTRGCEIITGCARDMNP